MKIKSHLKNLTPYPPGKTIDEIRRELGIKGRIYKFNSNENPLGPSKKVINTLKEFLSEVNHYPEASYIELKKALAKRWSVSPEQVVLGNGSDEVMEFIFKALVEPEDEILISKPSFLMYEKFAEIYGAKIKKIPLNSELKHNLPEFLKNLSEKTKLIFFDHPHNPTGSVLERKELENFIEDLPEQVLLILDEAYGEFVEDSSVPSGIELLQKGYKILILRTFSKAYGLAGLRLGYGITFTELAKVLDSVRQPFNINLFAYKAGLAVLEDAEYLEKSVNIIKEGRKYLSEELSRLGFKVFPSQANFIMVDFGDRVENIYQELLKKGFLLRPLKAYGFSTCLRISIGLPEENKILIKTIKELI